MRLVFGLILLAGLGLAGFAVHLAQNYIGAYQAALAQERARSVETIPTSDVWVAVKPISHGETITPDHVQLAKWPKDILPDSHFDANENPLIVQGQPPRVALREIDAFDLIRPERVSEPGGDAGITSRLEPGERALAIKVDVASGVSGFLRPGDRVDVFWTGRLPGAAGAQRGDVTKLIQEGVRLIAIDQSAESDSGTATIARTVTVAGKPETLAALVQAQSSGRLSLSLRNRQDDSEIGEIAVDQHALLGIEVAEAPQAEETPEVCNRRVRKGTEFYLIEIPCTN